MSCNHCGSPTPRQRLCKECARDERRDEATHDSEWYECPDCGVERSSGRGVTCWICRGNAESEVDV